MSRPWALTSPQSGHKGPLVEVAQTGRTERMATGALLAFALLWLIYTRLYFWLQPHHLTVDGPFMYLTGKPDPGCGLTRTFAWMWRGDLTHAVLVYPLGPLIFIGTVGFVAYSVAVIIGGRSLRPALSRASQRNIVVVAVAALALNWAAKWFWLGM
jgi:hypothetical protein